MPVLSRALSVQLAICTAGIGLLAVQPAAAGPVLLVPIAGPLPPTAYEGARLIGSGVLPGSLVVSRAPRDRDMTRFVVLAAPTTGCGTLPR